MGHRKQKYDEAVKLYHSGLSVEAVANYFNMSRQAMWGILHLRTTLRPRVKWGKDNYMYRGGKVFDRQAEGVVAYAVRKGVISPKPCEVCGSFKRHKDGRFLVHAHHDDYNLPLNIRWLCPKHHHEWHKSFRPIPKKDA